MLRGESMIRFALYAFAALAVLTSASPAARAQDSEEALERASVVIDGRPILAVRGVAGLPAEQRADAIEERILALARDPAFDPADLQIVEADNALQIRAGDRLLLGVLEADAALEGIDARSLAAVELRLVREAIVRYREGRTREQVLRGLQVTAVATVGLVAALALLVWLSRRVAALAEARWMPRIRALRVPGLHALSGPQIWSSLVTAARGLRFLVAALLIYLYVELVLQQFAATRPLGERLAQYLLEPLRGMGRAFVDELPSLLFLLVLWFVVRFVLRMLRLYFATIASGAVRVRGFESHWSTPTYRLVRIGVVAFALVVAYPYIPGSESEAFKGLSIFAGVLLSIGSSAFIANYVAGYSLIYRKLFAVGDRVRIGDVIGEVMETRVQVTRLRTPKNEEVILPNSMILQSVVTNYSTHAKERGLILHTTVGIGYEVPWRQVEGMLLTAAERTDGVLKDPPPFVRQRSLGDFAVNYELNAYVGTADDMIGRYDALHANILDVFNEYGVQIMTPAYEGDTPEPKVVPRERWHAAPSRRPAGDGG
jgi:small-conductance mechanosensitive channel